MRTDQQELAMYRQKREVAKMTLKSRRPAQVKLKEDDSWLSKVNWTKMKKGATEWEGRGCVVIRYEPFTVQ